MCVESLVPTVRGEPCGAQGDMTRDDLQCWDNIAAMWNNCNNNVVTLCFAKNRRFESYRVTSPLSNDDTHGYENVALKGRFALLQT